MTLGFAVSVASVCVLLRGLKVGVAGAERRLRADDRRANARRAGRSFAVMVLVVAAMDVCALVLGGAVGFGATTGVMLAVLVVATPVVAYIESRRDRRSSST